MREKSKKTIKTRLLALLLVFCMTCQMISYSPGNVVRAEGEDEPVAAAEGPSTIKAALFNGGVSANADKTTGSTDAAFKSAIMRFIAKDYAKEEPVSFAFDLRLEDSFLGDCWGQLSGQDLADAEKKLEAAQSASGDDAKKEVYAALNAFLKGDGGSAKVNRAVFSYNFGNQFKENGEVFDVTHEVTGTVAGLENMPIGTYVLTQNADTGDVKVAFTFEPYLCGMSNVRGGFNLELNLADSLFDNSDTAHVDWDGEKNELVIKGNLDKTETPARDNEITMTKASVKSDGAKISNTDDLYIDYKINIDVTDGKPINGLTLEDRLPKGLTVESVKLDGKALTLAADDGSGDYTVTPDEATGLNVLHYTFPENPANVRKAEFAIRAALTNDYYAQYLNDNKINTTFVNKASLRGSDNALQKESGETNTTMNTSFFTKEGKQNALNGNLFDWIITVNTHFSEFVDAWIVDKIDNKAHHYIESGDNSGLTFEVTRDGITTTETMDIKQVSDDSVLKNYSYADLTNEALRNADQVLNNCLKQLSDNNTKAILYTKDGEDILIFPFEKFTNAKVKIFYTTQLKDTANADLSNEVKFLFRRLTYGGPGTDLDFDIDIGKEVGKTYSPVQKEAIGDINWDSRTQSWRFKINHYQEEIADLTITESMAGSGLTEELLNTYKPTYNFYEEGVKKQEGKEVLKAQSGVIPAPYYEIKDDSVIFHFGKVAKNQYYDLYITTDVTGQLAVSSPNLAVKNTARYNVDSATGSDVEVPAQKTVDNTMVRKACVEPYYDQNGGQTNLHWQVEVNPHHLPITNGKLLDILPDANMHGALTKITRYAYQDGKETESKATKGSDGTWGFGDTSDIIITEIDESKTKTGTSYGELSKDEMTFTFANQAEDTARYVFEYTSVPGTLPGDVAFLNMLLSKNGENIDDEGIKNEVRLSGYVGKLNSNKITDGGTREYAAATAPAIVGNTALAKNGSFDPDKGTITWNITLNEGLVDMTGKLVDDRFEDNQLLQMVIEDEDNPKKSVKVTAYSNVQDMNAGKNGQDVTAVEDFTECDDLGFIYKVPGKATVKNKILVFTFETYITADAAAADVSNTVKLKTDDDNKVIEEVNSGADGLEDYFIDDYGSAWPNPYIKAAKKSVSENNNGQHPLSLTGAEFTLTKYKPIADNKWQQDGDAKTRTGLASGVSSFLNLTRGVLYKLEETKAPAGYGIDDAGKTHYFMFTEKSGLAALFSAGMTTGNATLSDGTSVDYDKFTTILNTYSYEYTDTPAGKIQFQKVGDDDKGLNGVSFSLKRTTDGLLKQKEAVKSANVGSVDGVVTFDQVDPGEYDIIEMKDNMPGGYPMTQGVVMKVKVEPDEIKENACSVTYYNMQGKDITPTDSSLPTVKNTLLRANVKFKKTDQNGNALKGAKFTLANTNGDAADKGKNTTLYKDYFTDANGQITIDNLSCGTYTLTEDKNSVTNLKDGAAQVVIEFKVERDDATGGSKVTVNNKDAQNSSGSYDLGTYTNNLKYGYVNLNKKSHETITGTTDQPLEGAEFAIYEKTNTDVNGPAAEAKPFLTLVTDSNGQLPQPTDDATGLYTDKDGTTKKALIYGDYWIKEVKTTDSHAVDEKAVAFKINSSDGADAAVTNTTAWISKDETGDPTVNYNGTTNDSSTYLNNLIRGKVSVKKTGVGTGLSDLSGAEFEVRDDNTLVATLKQTGNAGEYKLANTKNDASLTEISAKKIITGLATQVDYLKANNSGDLELLAGTYDIVETKAPKGYVTPSAKVSTVKIDTDGKVTYDGNESVPTITNAPLTANLQINKTDDKGDKLDGITFKLTANDGKDGLGAIFTERTADTDGGTAKFTGLSIGTYTLTETLPTNSGYKAPLPAMYTVTVEQPTEGTNKLKVTVKNTNATDATAGLLDASGNKKNELISDNLDNGATMNATIYNTPIIGTIEFTKKDTDGRTLKGIKFELWRKINDGYYTDKVAETTPDQDGKVSFTNIPYANYELREVEGAQGSATTKIAINKSNLTVTSTSGNEAFVYNTDDDANTLDVIENTLNKASIQLTKQDQNGAPLDGVEFNVQRKGTADENSNTSFVLKPSGTGYTDYIDGTGNPVTATSDANGILKVENLVYGDYQLVEKSTDNLADTSKNIPVTFSVDKDGAVTNVKVYDKVYDEARSTTGTSPYNIGEVRNTLRYGYVNLLKKNEEGQVLSGTQFDIYKKNADDSSVFVKTVTTNSDGKIDQSECGTALIYGNYIIKEKAVANELSSYYTLDTTEYTFTIGDATGHLGTAWISPGSKDNVIYQKESEAEPTINPITNTAKRQPIELKKTGANDAALSGAVFAVYDNNTLVAELMESTPDSGTYDKLKTTGLNSAITDNTVIENKTIQVSGKDITIPYIKDNKLLAGDYTIREVKQPDGYTLPSQDSVITVKDAAVTVSVANTETSFKVDKVSNEPQSNPDKLSGASLEIRKDKNGAAVSDAFKWVSGGAPHDVTGLPAGTYWLVETAAPDGYLIAEPIQFTLSNDNKLYSGDKTEGTPLVDNLLTMTDIRIYGQAKLTKTVTGSNETLSGVPFKLYKYTGDAPNLSETSADTLIADGLTTDNNGVIDTSKLTGVTNKETNRALSAGLWTGKYYFLEQPSDGLYYDEAQNLVTFVITDKNHYTAEKNNPVSVDMSNDKFKTDILFTKYDTTDVKGIAGVSFTLKRSSSHDGNYDETVNADIKTGADGTATLSLDKKGQYKLEETVTPTGYDSATKFVGTFEITDADHGQEVNLNGTNRMTAKQGTLDSTGIANDRLPGSMTITKVDAQNNTKLDNAEFALYKDGGETPILTGTTGNTYVYDVTDQSHTEAKGNTGELKITNLPWGHYKLVETTPPDGYILSSTPLEFTIKAGQVDFGAVQSAATTIENAQSVFTLNKADASSDNLVNGAAFTLTDETGTEVWKTPENTAPVSTWSNITGILVADKTYTLTEIKAPDGYEKAAPVKIVMDKQGAITVTAGEDHASIEADSTITVKDQPIEIGLEKIDAESNAALSGAEFEVEGTFAGSVGGVITVTPENFKEELKGHLIAGGTYILREITPPKGYVVAGSIAFTVNDAGQVTIINKPEYAEVKDNETIVLKNTQNEIFIQKTDADGKAIGGAEFSLSGVFADGETVKTIDTKEDQPYNLKGLLIAEQNYTLTETRAADGYKLETRPVEISMSKNGTISVAPGTDRSMAEVTADGLTLKFKDQPITLSLQKTDANNGNRPLKGAKFEMTGDLADGSKKTTIDLTQKESESLSALLIASTGTEKHEYTLTETTAPEGYQLQQTPVKFTVDKDGRVTITNIDAVKGFAALTEDKLSLSFANTLKQGNITFIKYGTNDENALNAKAELSGAVFGLYTDAGATIPVKDAAGKALTATSGEDGNVAFKDIYVGTYYMKEIAAPSSYTADSTVYQAVIDKDGKCDGLHAVAGTEVSNEAIHEATNQAVRGKISIVKTDSFDGKAIKDIEFTLTKKDKEGKDITVKTGKTDEDGNLVFSNLLMDTEYRVYETKTHSGYVLSTVTENVTLSTEETEKAVAFTNDPTKLTFKKVDTTGAGLAGAEFTLYDGSQEKATATSDKDGMVTFLYLEKGKTYTVKETKRPGEDYLPSSTEFKAVVDKDGTYTLKNNDETVTEVVNADAGVITVNKTGENGALLAGAVFALKNEAGETVQTQTTGENGQLIFKDVPMGSYTIVETASPDPYAVSGDVTAVTLSRGANQKVSVSRVNTLSQVIFHKRGVITEGCAGNLQHAPLEGAVYGLYQDPECATEPVYTATSSNPGEGCRVIFTGVARGTWYMKEIEAPQYYTLDTTVYKAVVDGDGRFEGLTNLDDTKVADNRVVDAAVTTDIVLKKVNEQKPDEVLPDSTYGLFKKVAKTAPVQARAFSLFGRDNTPEVEDESEWQKIAEATTGQDGYLRFEGVLMGVEYSIRELKAPEGSHVSEKPVNIKFGVNDAGTPVIESIDLGLADPNDPNSAPTASVDPETGEIVWLEPSIVAEISKTDMNANLLAGAKLRITVKDENGAYVPLTREDGQPVEWISGDQPETFVKLMKIGKDYRLEEIEAPSGYKLEAPVDFIVKSPEQGVGPGENLSEQVVLKNELTSLFISKTTINGTDELPGAVLTVYEAAEDGSIVRDEAGNEVVARTITGESLSWISGTEMKKIEGLKTGAYVLREITAPDGYEVAEEITFTLMPDGSVTVGGEACEGNIVRMQDKPAPETVTPGVPDEPQTSTPNNPEINGGADTGIAGSVSPATFWGVMALLSVTALLVCSVVVWRRKRW